MPENNTLNSEILQRAASELAEIEPAFARILNTFGVPPLWDRAQSFATLLYIILEQQVSLASAKAAFLKLEKKLGDIFPENFLRLTDRQLKTIGFSQQKTRYGRILAREIYDGKLDLNQLAAINDDAVKNRLMALTGIGHWTSDIYLLMVLLRADVWPHGDRALAVAAYEVFELEKIPDYDSLRQMAEKWQPWRSVAARFLWHYYLSTPRKKL